MLRRLDASRPFCALGRTWQHSPIFGTAMQIYDYFLIWKNIYMTFEIGLTDVCKADS